MQATNVRAMPLRSQAIAPHGSCGRLLAAGLSEFEPDPIRALEKARIEATRR